MQQGRVETSENCCCPSCRDLGYVAFDELRSIIADLDLAYAEEVAKEKLMHASISDHARAGECHKIKEVYEAVAAVFPGFENTKGSRHRKLVKSVVTATLLEDSDSEEETAGEETRAEKAVRAAALALLEPFPEGVIDKLTKRTHALERFLQYDYAKRLEIQSPNARLCVTMALTTANDRRFKQCCGHGRCDETVGEAPLCWNEEVLKREGRPSRKEDWNADCEFCAKKAGKVTRAS